MKFKRIAYPLIFLLLILIAVPEVTAQKVDFQIDGQKIKDLITVMAKDEALGRKPLTPEFFKMHDWARDKFKEWGLEPGGDNGTFFQTVPITGRRGTFAFSKGTPKMIINKREFFVRFDDFSLDPRSVQGKKIQGNVVFAGYGISALDKGLDEYANIDVKNKFVFVFKGTPNDVRAPRGFFSPQRSDDTKKKPENWDIEAMDSTKIVVAYEKGAAGIFLYQPDQDDDPYAGYRRAPVEKSPFTRDFMVVSSLSERIYQWLFWKDPQESSRAFARRMDRMRLDIKEKKSCSYETDNHVAVTGYKKTDLYGEKFGNYECRNVIARLTGNDPKLKDEYIVLGAHFDHLGVRNGQVYNGADDNASGSGVVMEVARLMAKHKLQPKRTVYFCLWTGEELGLIGSQYWADNPTAGATLDNVVIYFNMDMVGLGDQIGAPGALNFPSIWDVIKADMDSTLLSVISPSEGGPGGSDHSAFIVKGIESMALMTRGGGGHPDYHDLGDDSEKMEPEILGKTGQFILQGTVSAGNATETLIIPDRQHLYDAMRWNVAVVNPKLKGRGSWSLIRGETRADLVKQVIKKVQTLKKPASTTQQRRFWRRRPGSPVSTGITGAQVDYDLDFFKIVQSALTPGRLDVNGDDGIWFDNGLTDKGREAFTFLEDSSIVIHLINPSKESLTDVLSSAKKPFMVSGKIKFDEEQINVMNEKEVLVCVDFDPKDVDACVTVLEKMKEVFGDLDNLLLNVVSKDELNTARKALYKKLIEKGWTKKEIYAIGGAGESRRSRGNLDRFSRR